MDRILSHKWLTQNDSIFSSKFKDFPLRNQPKVIPLLNFSNMLMAGAWERRLGIILTFVTNSSLVIERKRKKTPKTHKWAVLKPGKIQVKAPHHRIPLYNQSTATELSHPLVGGRKKTPNFKHLLSLLVTSSLPITRTDYSQFKSVGDWKEQRDKQEKKKVRGILQNFSMNSCWRPWTERFRPTIQNSILPWHNLGKGSPVTYLTAFFLMIYSSIA